MKALILAAGGGTRLHPLTRTRPKHLLPIANKPLLEYVIDAISPHVSEMCFVLHTEKERMESHIQSYTKKKARIVFQEELKGTADACSLSPYKEFLCVNGDILFEKGIVERMKALSKKGMCIVSGKEVEHPSHYGAIYEKNGMLEAMREKEENPRSSLANMGIYYFNSSILDAIQSISPSQRKEYELPDAINNVARHEGVHVLKDRGFWQDVGRPWDLLTCNSFILSRLRNSVTGKVERNATIIPPVRIGKGTTVRGSSYIVGPVVIGKDCLIGPNAFLRQGTVIGDGCHIGASVEIKNSLIFPRTKINHLSYIGDSIIGENCNLGAGTITANLRHDGSSIRMEVSGILADTGRRKLGCVMGDNTKTGIQVGIAEGRVIGNDVSISPAFFVSKNIPPHTTL